MSDSLDRKLVWYERAALKGHLFVCKVCPKLLEQFRVIQAAAKQQPTSQNSDAVGQNSAEPTLSPNAKDRIKRLMRDTNSSSQ